MRYLLIMLVLGLILCPLAHSAEPVANQSVKAMSTLPTQAVGNTSPLQVKPVAPAAVPNASSAKIKTNRAFTFGMFLAVIAMTGSIVIWASKKNKTAADYYAAGGGITGFQNGWAIAGEHLSAATFLGTTGLISLFGLDGFNFAVGPFICYITILLIIAEPCRNAGKYTLGDILSFRSSSKAVRATASLSAVVVSIFYLIGQMVGAGKLMSLLLGIPYRASVIGVGILIVLYVSFGGMKATTWVQIIKAGLLMFTGLCLTTVILWKSGFNLLHFFDQVATSNAVQDHVRALMKHPIADPSFDYGQRFLEMGLFLKNPLDQISLGIAWILGAAGLPHILMRFFTVPNAKEARKSVIVAMFLIGAFLIMVTFIGFGAAIYITPQQIMAVDKGGNMATLMMAQYLGGGASTIGGDLLLAFICAITFTTIVAVVSGLVLASSAAISHDLYFNIIKGGKADQRQQVKVAKYSTVIIGIIAILLGIACETQNIAQLTILAFSVTASSNFPVILLALFWKRFNTAGIVAGLLTGSIVSIGLVLISPIMTYPKKIAADAKQIVVVLEKKQAEGVVLAEKDLKTLDKARQDYAKNKDGKSLLGFDEPVFPLKNPAIVSVPIGFMSTILITLLFRNRREEEMFQELYVRQITGYGVEKAAEH